MPYDIDILRSFECLSKSSSTPTYVNGWVETASGKNFKLYSNQSGAITGDSFVIKVYI